ncbi:hypothetical protein LUR56_01590 [Streptomyces sp. MT29]|nr:hypothetical protein [Streptomyces sp. MT29]
MTQLPRPSIDLFISFLADLADDLEHIWAAHTADQPIAAWKFAHSCPSPSGTRFTLISSAMRGTAYATGASLVGLLFWAVQQG